MSSRGLKPHLTGSVACLLTLLAGPVMASDGAVAQPGFGTRLTIPASGSGSLEFAHPAYERAIATVRIEDGRVVAGTDADALTLATFDPSSQWNDEMSVLLMDIDFDGYQDVGVLNGVGYGGVNYFWNFYRADAQRGFVPVGTLSNPQRDDLLGRIWSSSRSGPAWTRDVYGVLDGQLELIFSRTSWSEYDVIEFPNGKGTAVRAVIAAISPDPWDLSSLEDYAYRQFAIAANSGRSYFHDEPDEATRRGAYLVEGDQGYVSDVTEAGDWFFMQFTHPETQRTTTGWMRAEELILPQG